MRVSKIAHASIVVEHGDIRCFMDPVLVSPYENGANVFDPEVEIDTETLLRDANLIVISHAHMDHFSPRSLNLFDRSVPVLYPSGEPLIERALERLGFTDSTPLAFGDNIDVGGLELIPTPSRVAFPECGMIFRTAERSLWNLADSKADESVVGAGKKLIGTPDLLLAAYQPLVETPLIENGLGSDFPYEIYNVLLERVWSVAPRRVAPIACGFRYAHAPWLNDRGFPITERQFALDVVKGMPALEVLDFPHGGSIDLDRDCAVDGHGLEGVKRIGPRYSNYD